MNIQINAIGQPSRARRARARWLLSIALASVMAAALLVAPMPRAWQATAQQLSCGFTQITNSTEYLDYYSPSICGNGTRIAFLSRADLTGGNPDLSGEVFLYASETDSFTQISNLPAPLPGRAFYLSQPSINGDGTRIVFEIFYSELPGTSRIFLYDVETGTLTQITQPTVSGYLSAYPSISGDGTDIAFVSKADLTGVNPDHRPQIFLYDVLIGSFTQITDFPAGVAESPLAISSDGTRIAFSLLSELWLFDTRAGSLTRITDSSEGATARNPSISGDGSHITFQFQRTFLNEQDQIYIYDVEAGNLTRITYSTESFFTGSGSPTINGNGSRVAFSSNLDLTGGNPDHNNNVFLYDAHSGSFTQVTNSPNGFGASAPTISGDGSRVAFSSNLDLTGGNPDHNSEIFVASCERLAGGNSPIRVYPISVYTDMLPELTWDIWIDPASGNWVLFDTYGRFDRISDFPVNTTVTGNVTVRHLGDGTQRVGIDVRTTRGFCWGANVTDENAFGYSQQEVDLGLAPASVGRGTLRITFEPQPVGPIRYPWPIQSVVANVACEGPLRAGSGYPEGTPGFAQTTQTGLYNTGVPGGCPREHDADCFPAEKVQFKPRGN